MTAKTALVFGISGQDGSYIAELLCAKGYRVAGTARDPARAQARLGALTGGPVNIHEVDLRDSAAVAALIGRLEPDEIYNFAAFSTGSGMYEDPVEMGDVNGLAVVRILEAIRSTGRPIRFCQASSSEMFRATEESPQRESTRFAPASPYGAAKLYAHHSIGIARDRHGIFACSAILFNHESPRRPAEFVSRKVTRAVAEIRHGASTSVRLGNLSARRDWGHARDVVHGMWLMLQQDAPDDYVLATGKLHSVADLCAVAFAHAGLDWREHVDVDPELARAPEAVQLVGDASRARDSLGWSPRTSFEDMIKEMVEADLHDLQFAVRREGLNA